MVKLNLSVIQGSSRSAQSALLSGRSGINASMTDSYLIRVQASAIGIESELNLGDIVSAIINGEVVKIELKDDYDGSISTIYHIKGQFAECINKEKRSIVSGKTDSNYR